MQRRDAVHLVRADDGQVCHAHLPVGNDGHLFDKLVLPGEAFPQIVAETAVDLFEDHVDAGQAACDQIFLPGFERFGHDRVVGIGKGRGGDRPGVVPSESVFIHQQAHEFGDGECRMRVVDVDRGLLRQQVQRPVAVLVVVDDVLQRGGNEEVLLFQAQRLALVMVVCGIQDLRDHLRFVLLFHAAQVIALREELHIEVRDVACPPQAQNGYRFAVFAGDHHVIRQRFYFFIAAVCDF